MKKVILWVVLALFAVHVGFAQTEISGGIFSSTAWSKTDGPYEITGDVVVYPGATLTILPGAVVKFGENVRLELREGNLIADGTADEPILFSVAADNPTEDTKWEGILNTSPENISVDISLSYVTIEYAKTGVNYGKGFANRSIDFATFQYNDRGVFDGAQGYNWVTISNSIFIENGVGMEGRMSALNCNFTGNDVGFGNPMTFQDITAGARVTNCTFNNNEVAIGSVGNIITIAIIENSTFQDNGKGFDGYRADINNSTFTGSTELGVGVIRGAIQTSLFTENGTGLEVRLHSFELDITNNIFEGNAIGLQINDPGANIQENTICGNTNQAVVLGTPSAVNINNNCWCTTDLNIIADQVTDAFDDVSLGIATYDQLNVDCIGDRVYPGDSDDNGQVDAWDVLQIGLAYDFQGTPRPNGSMDWFGHTSDDWSDILSNNVNAKHADCNGDGVVDEADIDAIQMHYGKFHSGQVSYDPLINTNESYPISLQGPTTLVPGTLVTMDVLLSDANQPMNDVYGIAFAIEGPASFVQPNSFNITMADSWLGTTEEVLTMTKTFPQMGRIELAMVKKDHLPASGYGKIASISFVVSDEINSTNGDPLSLVLTDIQTITSDGTHLIVENEPIDVILSTDTPASETVNDAISTYPNPARDQMFIQANGLDIEQVTLFNSAGRRLQVWRERGINQISLGAFQAGLYLLEVQTNEGVGVKKVVLE